MIRLCNQQKYQEKDDPLLQQTLLKCPVLYLGGPSRRECKSKRQLVKHKGYQGVPKNNAHIVIRKPTYKRRVTNEPSAQICKWSPNYENIDVVDAYGNAKIGWSNSVLAKYEVRKTASVPLLKGTFHALHCNSGYSRGGGGVPGLGPQ